MEDISGVCPQLNIRSIDTSANWDRLLYWIAGEIESERMRCGRRRWPARGFDKNIVKFR